MNSLNRHQKKRKKMWIEERELYELSSMVTYKNFARFGYREYKIITD